MALHDEEIARLETQLHERRGRMDEHADAFRGAAVPWYQEVVPRLAQAGVVAQSQKAEELGREAISAMKREVEALAGRADELVRQRLTGEGVWMHTRDNEQFTKTQASYSVREFSGPHGAIYALDEVIENQLKAMLSPLGDILSQVGLADSSEGWHREYAHQGPAYRYAGPINVSPQMVAAASLYGEEWRAAQLDARQLLKLIDERSRSNAKNLWDSA